MHDEKYLNAAQMLLDAGIMCEVVRDGTGEFKVVAEGNGGFIDYYPNTGTWKTRSPWVMQEHDGFSLRAMITYILDEH